MSFRSGDRGSLLHPVEITDPRALRALAHPARIAIMQHLILEGPATATECAGAAGMSPSACSYHLRALARYGLVEEEPAEAADQRHRPWRPRMIAMAIGQDLNRSDALRAADRLLLESVYAWMEDLRANYYDHETEYPTEWQASAGGTQAILHVTAAELTRIRAQIDELLAGYVRLDPGDRPAGSRRIHVMTDFTPGHGPRGQDSSPAEPSPDSDR